jgi:hypothetical protein
MLSGLWLWLWSMVRGPTREQTDGFADMYVRVREMAEEFPHVQFTGIDLSSLFQLLLHTTF